MVEDKLTSIILPAVEALGVELWGYELLRHGTRTEFWVYVDSETGVTLDQCAEVSRQISAVLDVEDPITERYQLQVSSPGMDRRFFKPEQYQRYLGKKIKVRLRMARNGTRNFSGILLTADDKKIVLQCSPEDHIELEFDQIEKAHLVADI